MFPPFPATIFLRFIVLPLFSRISASKGPSIGERTGDGSSSVAGSSDPLITGIPLITGMSFDIAIFIFPSLPEFSTDK
jgi:hypothetical protein